MTPRTPRKRKTKIQQKAEKLKLRLPDDLNRPMPIAQFARAHRIDASTVHRGLENGTLKFIRINKRRHVLPPVVEQAATAD